jgi:hypothetical protein
LVEAQYGAAGKSKAEEAYQKQLLDVDLDLVIAARGDANIYSKLGLPTCVSLHNRLIGKPVEVSMSDAALAAERMRNEWQKQVKSIRRDEAIQQALTGIWNTHTYSRARSDLSRYSRPRSSL